MFSSTHRAHICGLMSNHLNFRLERIIALDPARPLIRPGNQNRLDSGDARAVQVIHTNAGYYGEAGRVGHIDFCVNGGRRCSTFLTSFLAWNDNWNSHSSSVGNRTARTPPTWTFARTFGQSAIWLSPSSIAAKSLPSRALGSARQASIFIHLARNPSDNQRAVTALPSITAFRWDNRHRKRD